MNLVCFAFTFLALLFCAAASPAPVLSLPSGAALEVLCEWCAGSENVTSVTPFHSGFEFDNGPGTGPVVVVVQNGKCKPHELQPGEKPGGDGVPDCDPDTPCRFSGHYQVGIAVAHGTGPFYNNSTPPLVSTLVLGGTYHAMQSSVSFTAPCGTDSTTATVTFRTVSHGALLCVIEFKGKCAGCNTAGGAH